MNNIWFQKVSQIRIQILVFGLKYSNNIRIPNYSLTSGYFSGVFKVTSCVPGLKLSFVCFLVAVQVEVALNELAFLD